MPSNPKHLAIVMDGNGRWASRHGYSRSVGHRQGLESTLRIVASVAERDISYLSLFALSCENMSRPLQELNNIEDLILIGAPRFRQLASQYRIALRVIGDHSILSDRLAKLLAELTKENNHSHPQLHLQIAINYSGQWDILQALNRIRQRDAAQSSNTTCQDLGREDFSQYLSTAGYPDPDLLIRSSGESRLSNFMLWQMAYTELYFHEKMWPEFDINDLDEALASYGRRERRFGLVDSKTLAS